MSENASPITRSGGASITGDGKTRFGEKLVKLAETLRLVLELDHSRLARALGESSNGPVLAVGSGGSIVTAAYFARCRETLHGKMTNVMTPTEFTLGVGDIEHSDVWLFSAGADNPDFRAALHSARVRRARRINVVTRRADAAAALGLKEVANSSVHIVPVADEKDSFLATHSLVSSVSALLVASNMLSGDPVEGLGEAFRHAALAELRAERRRHAVELFATLTSRDTLLIIADPQISPVASLLETSIWETAICSVQLTDFRNFAHGRHTWLHHHPHNTVMLALTGHETEELWSQTKRLLPSELRQISIELGNCGRFRNAVGVIQGLVLIEAMGRAVGIDPGKPGIADFGRGLYEGAALEQLSEKLGPAVRQKRRAKLEHDHPECNSVGIRVAARDWLTRLSSSAIGGIVFDYDGTIVATEKRLAPPAKALVKELERIHALGVRLAIATGRGGSAGERLREVLPVDMHAHVLMGYYNGGYLKRLDIDIRDEPPDEAPEIVQVAAWLAARTDLFSRPFSGKHSFVQVSIQLDNVLDLERFSREIATCRPVGSGAVRVVRSGHSLDLIPVSSSKTRVAEYLLESLAADIIVLRVGDQGSRGGNDNEFLTDPYGVSVKDVCGRDDGCWSLFGAELTGPDAVLRLLQTLKPDSTGLVRIDTDELRLDKGPK